MAGINWNAVTERAESMSDAAIHYAIVDIQKTLPHADAMDREGPRADGSSRGGDYRDEISVLRAVKALRRKDQGKAARRARRLGTLDTLAGFPKKG